VIGCWNLWNLEICGILSRLFPRLPLDTGTWILHLSGIRWKFFILSRFYESPFRPNVLSNVQPGTTLHKNQTNIYLDPILRLRITTPVLLIFISPRVA
jgi:hypothetical protein